MKKSFRIAIHVGVIVVVGAIWLTASTPANAGVKCQQQWTSWAAHTWYEYDCFVPGYGIIHCTNYECSRNTYTVTCVSDPYVDNCWDEYAVVEYSNCQNPDADCANIGCDDYSYYALKIRCRESIGCSLCTSGT